LGYPDKDSATRILLGQSSDQMDLVQPVLQPQELLSMQEKTAAVHADEALCRYVVDLTERTRSSEYISQGISPRGSIAVLKLARAHAFSQGRDFIVPEDIHAVFYSVSNHRIIINTKAKATGKEIIDILMDILDSVPIPKLS
ncbi:MAG: MoxR family ATPase, partial [Lachnospiraceae bacterium]|nr:MoxR family ATPase [Lachnospiraceae bacterium]